MKYSSDKRVVFNQRDHSYFKGNKRLTSVTSFLNKFKNEFDSDFYSKKAALKEGVPQSVILDRWKEKGIKSVTIGTAIHSIFEDYFLNNYHIYNDELVFDDDISNDSYYIEYLEKKKIAISFINDFFITKRLTPIHSEYIVYNEKLSGHIDMICKDNEGNNYILDFKTNEKIDKNNYGKFYKNELSFLGESTYNNYCLQLSIYKSMLKKIKINNLFIIHITIDGYKFIECEDIIENYELQYLIK